MDQDGVTGEDGQEWNQKPKSKAHEHDGFVVILIVAIAYVCWFYIYNLSEFGRWNAKQRRHEPSQPNNYRSFLYGALILGPDGKLDGDAAIHTNDDQDENAAVHIEGHNKSIEFAHEEPKVPAFLHYVVNG